MEPLTSQRRRLAVHRMAQVSEPSRSIFPVWAHISPGLKLTKVPRGSSIRRADYT